MKLAAGLLVGALALAACGPSATLDEGVRTDASATLKPGDDLFIVQFEAQADLTGVDGIADWDERGRVVMERLQETAAVSQADAIAAAEAAGARYVSLWISNSLVFAGMPELGPELAALRGDAEAAASAAARRAMTCGRAVMGGSQGWSPRSGRGPRPSAS